MHACSLRGLHLEKIACRWMDLVEIKLRPTEGEALELYAHSCSTSVVPAAAPLAPLMSVLLWWIVFSDIGQNELHLNALRSLLVKAKLQVEVSPDKRGKQIMGRHRMNQAGDVLELMKPANSGEVGPP